MVHFLSGEKQDLMDYEEAIDEKGMLELLSEQLVAGSFRILIAKPF
jgi:hypothetical protein